MAGVKLGCAAIELGRFETRRLGLLRRVFTTMLLLHAVVTIALGSPGFPPCGVTHSYSYDPAGRAVLLIAGNGKGVQRRVQLLTNGGDWGRV